ncbi:MAG TPA: oligosaccharide flippase family protein [Lunatimonas sp.]|nr:oligosaccharide flippase family protein [Lunatimonas sp.]
MKLKFSGFYSKITRLITNGHARSIKAKKNILASLFIRGGSIAVSLIMVPMTLNYVDETRYGIWLTLSSLVAWLSYFDVGFGQGLRNRFAESVAKGQFTLARSYISTTYAMMTIIMVGMMVIFLIASNFLDWSAILNTAPEMAPELGVVAMLVFSFFCLQFVLQLFTTVLTANQEPAKANLIHLSGSVISLTAIYILMRTTEGSLINLASVLSVSPVVVLFLASLWLYNTSYRRFSPKLKLVKFELVGDLMNLGVKFFVIQIGVVILFSTQNIIITQLFGPSEVTSFNIAYKLFSVVPMGFMIIVTPLWSAFTDAYIRKEFDWVKGTLSKMLRFWFLTVIGAFFLLILSPYFYDLWLGDKVSISFSLSAAMCLQVLAFCFQSIYVYFLNGIGKIQMQLYLIIICATFNIPLTIFLGKMFGVVGVSFASFFMFSLTGFVYMIQTRKIINNTASGLWLK